MSSQNYTKTCRECGVEFVSTHRDKKFHNHACQQRYFNRQRNRGKEYHSRDITEAKKPITVIYPGVTLCDHWTRRDYEMYKNDIPKDAVVFGI